MKEVLMQLFLIFGICVILLVALGATLVVITYFLQKVWIPYKRATSIDQASTMADTIYAVANLEFNIYDNNRFRQGGPALTTSTFDNYFEELSNAIINDLSPEFFDRASLYMNENAIVKMITGMVRNYLTSKLAVDTTALDIEEEE